MSKYYRINEYIPATELRVVNADGKQIGVMNKSEALEKARELELDLVEIAAKANPPVAKIIDFNKFKYDETKKDKAAKKGGNEGGIKELWFSPRIAQHDLNVRLKRTEEFLKEGLKVKLTVKFKGREMAHPELGEQVLKKAVGYFNDKIIVERDVKFEGRKLSVIIAKAKGSNKEKSENGVTVIKEPEDLNIIEHSDGQTKN